MRQDEKMFITDIDRTITKSNISGFLLPKLGVDHHHSGVVKILRGIAGNGYRVIYLTARPLGLDEDTRDYLMVRLSYSYLHIKMITLFN